MDFWICGFVFFWCVWDGCLDLCFLGFVVSKNAKCIRGRSWIFGFGIFDVKFDGSATDQSADFRYEFRSEDSILDIGPKEDNFFFLKPFFGVEYTSDSASYFLTGIYFEDNLGELFEGNKSKYYFTPSFCAGFYYDG